MQLKEVTHEENFCGKLTKNKFNVHNNRFVLFDRQGRELNGWELEKIPDYLELEVLEIKRSSYNDFHYFIGFPTTHVKIDIEDDSLLSWYKHEFGEAIEG